MRGDLKRTTLVAIAGVTGLIILVGYFLPLPILQPVRRTLLQWTIFLAGIALLIGIVNLVKVHVKKSLTWQAGSIYSVILLISFVIMFAIGMVAGPAGEWSLWIFNHVQVPVESSLLAIIAVFLIVSVLRMLYRRPTSISLLFLFTAVIVLVGVITIPWIESTLLGEARSWILRVPVTGGMRGILLGVALGAVASGLRVLIGADRPYEN